MPDARCRRIDLAVHVPHEAIDAAERSIEFDQRRLHLGRTRHGPDRPQGLGRLRDQGFDRKVLERARQVVKL